MHCSPSAVSNATPLLSAREISVLVERLSGEIRRSCTPPIKLLCVLDAAFIFAADLMREIRYPTSIRWVKASSYSGTEGGPPQILWAEDLSGPGTCLLVDTIVDSGRTVKAVCDHYKDLQLSVVALLVRQTAMALVDFAGKVIPEGFVVGYGLDYNGAYRGSPDIRILSLSSG